MTARRPRGSGRLASPRGPRSRYGFARRPTDPAGIRDVLRRGFLARQASPRDPRSRCGSDWRPTNPAGIRDVLRRGFLAAAVLGLAVFGPGPARAQSSGLTGYLQTVPLFAGPTPFTDAAASAFNRLRLSTEPVFGPLAVEIAWDHALTVRRDDDGAFGLGLGGLGAIPGGGEWLDLQWTAVEHDHFHWRHRLDRLNVAWRPIDAVELSVGRQAVSWGTTLFLTPADPFIPFSPADPFRVYRGGIDAVRARLYPGPLSEIDVVVRPSRTPAGEETTALARGLTTWRNWEVSGWGGALYGDAAGAVGLAGGLGAWAVRFEAVVRDFQGAVAGRGTIGLDRRLTVYGRDLGLVVEYQRDGRGAAAPDDFARLFQSPEFLRAEYQVYGRDEAAVQASYQVHPLLSVAGLWLWNLNDGSAVAAPSFSWSAGDETSVAGGVFFGVGADTAAPGQLLASEYGLLSAVGYLSLTWFF